MVGLFFFLFFIKNKCDDPHSVRWIPQCGSNENIKALYQKTLFTSCYLFLISIKAQHREAPFSPSLG